MTAGERQLLEPIHLNDFRAQWEHHRTQILAAVEGVCESGALVLGPEVAGFEAALAAAWGLPHAIGCASGLDAIEIGLRCAGLAEGDRVLTTPLSAFATSLAIVRAGGSPLFVDVDASGLLDLEQCEELLEEDGGIRFMVPVHLYGHALDADRLASLRDRFGLTIVEDCAQAIGATSHGIPVGSTGGWAATSFYPTKNLGCVGDGGALLTAYEDGARRAASLRDYGQSAKFEHDELGLNSRLDELQAAILRRAFLPELDRVTARRSEIARRYAEELSNPALVAPPTPRGSDSVWHLYPLLVVGDRPGFQTHLAAAEIATGVHYPFLIPDQKALGARAGELTRAPLERARRFADSEVSLPIHPYLSETDVDRVIAACNQWAG